MIRIVFVVIVLILLMGSCRSTRKIQSTISRKDTTIVVPPPVSNSEIDSTGLIASYYKAIQENKISFTTFSAKVDVDYKDEKGKNYNLNAHVRMYKDSVIWVSITAILGIEGLRALITRDSVKILDKQNKVYTARSVSYLQEVTALPLSLGSLQDLLVGNPIFLHSNIASYSKSPGTISLLSLGDYFKNLYTISDKTKLPVSSKLDDADNNRNRTCYLTYDDFENKKTVFFSTKRTINIAEKNTINIKLNFRQYEFNETLSFPFSIPKNYKLN